MTTCTSATGKGRATTFLGDCHVDSYLPTADGANTGLTPSPRTAHFSLVDEATPNDDTDFNESANPRGQGHLGVCGHGPQCCEHRRCPVNLNVDAGLRQVKGVVRSGGTDYPSAAQAVTTSGYKTAIRESDPAPGAPWTKAGVNGAEFGMEVACSGVRRSRELRGPRPLEGARLRRC